MKKYRVVYHQGDQITLRTKAQSGRVYIENESLIIEGHEVISIPCSSIQEAKMFRMHGSFRMIHLISKDGSLFLTVVRLNLFGLFVIVNFLATGRLFRAIKDSME